MTVVVVACTGSAKLGWGIIRVRVVAEPGLINRAAHHVQNCRNEPPWQGHEEDLSDAGKDETDADGEGREPGQPGSVVDGHATLFGKVSL